MILNRSIKNNMSCLENVSVQGTVLERVKHRGNKQS